MGEHQRFDTFVETAKCFSASASYARVKSILVAGRCSHITTNDSASRALGWMLLSTLKCASDRTMRKRTRFPPWEIVSILGKSFGSENV